MTRVGLISDTHGKLDPAIHQLFEGVAEILHAGDVVGRDILIELEEIAPVYAVRGNCDWGDTSDLPEFILREYGDLRVLVTHILGRGPGEVSGHVAGRVRSTEARMVLFGHTHEQARRMRDGVLYVNPGSISQGRDCPRSAAILDLGGPDPRIEFLTPDGAVLEIG